MSEEYQYAWLRIYQAQEILWLTYVGDGDDDDGGNDRRRDRLAGVPRLKVGTNWLNEIPGKFVNLSQNDIKYMMFCYSSNFMQMLQSSDSTLLTSQPVVAMMSNPMNA